jgi:putative salt-induced outer membrane protein YdiY
MKQTTFGTLALLALAGASVSGQDNNIPAPQPATDAAAAAAAAAIPPKPKWETTAGVGVSLTDGNSDTLLFTGNALTLRKWDKGEFSAGIDGGYGESEGEQNVGYLKGFAQYNYLITDRWYAFGRVDGLNDSIADIDYRFVGSAGIGYYLIKNDRTTLSVEAGPGYVWEKVGDDERDYAIIRFGEKFTHKLSDRARIWQSFEYQPRIDDWSEYFMSGEIGVEADLTKKMALRVVFQDWYVSEPAPGLESNDLKLVAGINYKFQ